MHERPEQPSSRCAEHACCGKQLNASQQSASWQLDASQQAHTAAVSPLSSATHQPPALPTSALLPLLQVFVEQKMMEVSGMDAFLVVQVFVEGTRAAVEAATAPPPPPPAATSSDDASDGDGAVAETDASLVATAAAAVGGQDTTAAGTVLAAAAEAAEAVGLDKKGAKKKEEEKKEAKKKKEEKEERPGFDHVVLGVAVAEKFPDGRLK